MRSSPFRRILPLFAAVVLLAFLFVPGLVQAMDQTVLTMGSWRTEDMEQMQSIFQEFTKTHPGIRIIFDPSQATEYDEVLRAQLEGGTAPDLFYLRSYGVSERLFESGFLAPLGEAPGLKANFRQETLDPWTSDSGVVYGLPMIATSHGVYYNKDIFALLGLSIPETWEEFLETARRIKDKGIIPLANAGGDSWTINEIVFFNMLPNFTGGRKGRLEYLSGKRCFNDASMVRAFQALLDLSRFFPPNQRLLKYQDSLQLFLQGKAAMWMGGSWDIPFFLAERPAFEWGVFAPPPPEGEKPQITFHLDAGVGLNAASRHKDEALALLDWMASPEFGLLMADELPGFFPMHKNPPKLQEPHADAFLSLNKGRGSDVRFVWDKLRDGAPDGYALMLECSNAVVNRSLRPKQAADALQQGLAKWYGPARNCGH